jgi:hypothetical protein
MSEDDVRRRRASRVPNMCPECVRPFAARTTTNWQFAVLLGKPSDGLEPSTPSLPWRFRGVTRVHARSLATHFLLQIGPLQAVQMRRETSRVSFLMCPFCVRALLPHATTVPALFGAVAKVADFPASSRGPRKGCAHRDADRCSMQRAARIRRLYRLRSSEGRRECSELLERMVDRPGICARPAEHARCCRTGGQRTARMVGPD